MSSRDAEGLGHVLGSQVPTHRLAPEYEYSRGDEAIEIAEIAGLQLDPYQREVLIDGLGVVSQPSQLHADQRMVDNWAAFEVGIELSRQNGKSVIFEARTLAGLYVFREKLIVYSAHKGETAMEAFGRIEELIRSDPDLLAEVKPNGFKRTNGKEAIELITGQKVKFRTRTSGGGRGLSGDCVFIDEAQDAEEDHVAALFPVLSARPNPQIWYAGSSGTKKSTVQGRLVRRCEDRDARLVYYRWASADDADPNDMRAIARVNPALGRRMTPAFVESERNALSREKFAQERMGIGDYPRLEGEDWLIPRRRWERAEDRQSKIVGPVVFAVEVRWNRQGAAISVAGRREDGHMHVETVADEVGTLWAVEELDRLIKRHGGKHPMLDPGSPANTLLAGLRDKNIEARLMKSEDLTKAWGDFYDGFTAEEPVYHHTGGTLLTSALAESATRNLGGSSTLRRATSANVAPFLSAVWAAHGVRLLEIEAEDDSPPPPPQSVREHEAEDFPRGRGQSDLATMSF